MGTVVGSILTFKKQMKGNGSRIIKEDTETVSPKLCLVIPVFDLPPPAAAQASIRV